MMRIHIGKFYGDLNVCIDRLRLRLEKLKCKFYKVLFNGFLNLGSNVFVPLIMFIIGMIAGLRFKKSFVAALTLGVAFSGMTLVVNYMQSIITPAGKAMSKAMHVSLTATDLG